MSEATNLPGDDGSTDIFIHDRKTGKTSLVSKTSGGDPATGYSSDPTISASGRYVAFESFGTNLPAPSAFTRIYVHDRKTGKTRLVSKTSSGEPVDGGSTEPDISGNGRFVAFESSGDNLPPGSTFGDVYVHDRKTGKTRLVSKTSAGAPLDSAGLEPVDLRLRALRGVRVAGDQPARGRHLPADLPPRP